MDVHSKYRHRCKAFHVSHGSVHDPNGRCSADQSMSDIKHATRQSSVRKCFLTFIRLQKL